VFSASSSGELCVLCLDRTEWNISKQLALNEQG
jgi:hypothetical protein